MFVEQMPLFIPRSKFNNIHAVLAAAQFQFADAVEIQGNEAFDQETFWTNRSIIVSS